MTLSPRSNSPFVLFEDVRVTCLVPTRPDWRKSLRFFRNYLRWIHTISRRSFPLFSLARESLSRCFVVIWCDSSDRWRNSARWIRCRQRIWRHVSVLVFSSLRKIKKWMRTSTRLKWWNSWSSSRRDSFLSLQRSPRRRWRTLREIFPCESEVHRLRFLRRCLGRDRVNPSRRLWLISSRPFQVDLIGDKMFSVVYSSLECVTRETKCSSGWQWWQQPRWFNWFSRSCAILSESVLRWSDTILVSFVLSNGINPTNSSVIFRWTSLMTTIDQFTLGLPWRNKENRIPLADDPRKWSNSCRNRYNGLFDHLSWRLPFSRSSLHRVESDEE